MFFCYLSYLNVDPIKRCLFLVLSLLVSAPFISLGGQVWFRYYVCIIFLRGIFVILVYFTRMSKYNFFYFRGSILIFLGRAFAPIFFFYTDLKISHLYLREYRAILFWLIFSLFYFINFTSYFLNYSGALRKA